MSRAGSLLFRSLVAIGLMCGFYLLAAAVAGTLLYIPYAEIVYLHRIDLRLAFFCLVGAWAVVWSVAPRPDRFQAPGPELSASEQGALFELLESVRTATGQQAPKHVYLIADVNAWVAQRGGFMGFGSRRVMGLGLPLMEVLTVDQLRAVLAHEFGHYYGGDTMLGPWIQKTRMGILRSVVSLSESWIRIPFTLYAKLFFRVTNAVSRQQEFAADALAARVAGPEALAEGLKQVHRAGAAFMPFWQNEYAPALQHNVRPPLGAGFSRFLQHQQIKAGLDGSLQQALAVAKVDPYDSHPPLSERCAALARFPSTTASGDARLSVLLLDGVPHLERDLLTIAVNPNLKQARAVDWVEVPGLVWHPSWLQEVRNQAAALADTTMAGAADLCCEPESIARKLVFRPGYLPDLNQRCQAVPRVVGAAIAVALIDAGWQVKGDLGDPITCTHGTDVLEPFALPARFASGEMTSGPWKEFCQRTGISSLPLDGCKASGPEAS